MGIFKCSGNDVSDQPEFDQFIWKLQGDTVRNLFLTQKSTDDLFSKFLMRVAAS